jgi:hypothetical protein
MYGTSEPRQPFAWGLDQGWVMAGVGVKLSSVIAWFLI